MSSDKIVSASGDQESEQQTFQSVKKEDGHAHESTSSYDTSEIGKAVPMTMVNKQGTEGEVKQMYVELGLPSKAIPEDDESIYSGSVHLGRLDTTKSRNVSNAQPDLTVTTAVESVIPPRLRRRPISEAPNQGDPVTASPKSIKRTSIALNEGLDQLMESANYLKEEPSADQKDTVKPIALTKLITGNSQDVNISSDAFETAEGDSAASSLESTSTSAPLRLPKRPNAASLGKARQASLEYAVKSTSPTKSMPSEVLSLRSVSSLHTEEELMPKKEASLPPVEASSITDNSDKTETTALIPHTITSGISNPSPRTIYQDLETRNTPPSMAIINPVVPLMTGLAEVANDDKIHKEVSHLETVGAISSPINVADTRIGGPPESPIDSSSLKNESEIKALEADNEYFDIEEPVLVSQPAQARVVKDNIKLGKKKSVKRNKRNRKSDSELKLKPFSYATLVNLLESINGTVIGEEFDSLNLPVQEKQLIEKIIDLLSRLTSDMVIDESRYAVGIARLEKAHRALEGFM